MNAGPATDIGRVGITSRACEAMFEPQKEDQSDDRRERVGISYSSGHAREDDPVANLRPGDTAPRAAADAVVEGDHLRHMGHWTSTRQSSRSAEPPRGR